MNPAEALEAIFPPAADLFRVLTWWQAQPEGAEAYEAGLAEFFAPGEPHFDQTDEAHAPEVIRFLEWVLLDRPVAGQTPAARYAAEAPADERDRLNDLIGSRHAAWQVTEVAGDRLTLAPWRGGEPVTLTHGPLAADAHPGEWIVGRLYPWGGEWMPSIALFFMPAGAEERFPSYPIDPLLAQRAFFMAFEAESFDPVASAAMLEAHLARFQPDLSLEEVRGVACACESADELIQRLYTEGQGRKLLSESEKEHPAIAIQIGTLLANLWAHTPTPRLGGRSPMEDEAAVEEALAGAVEALFEAVGAEDEAALRGLLDPEGELAMVFDLWGFAGLRLLTDWGASTGDREILGLGFDMGAMRAAVGWAGPEGPRGATVWFVERPEGFLATEAVPELEEQPVANPAFVEAQEKGVQLAWRAEPADTVEGKLRTAVAARKLPMLDQATMIKAWRMTAPIADRDPDAPEAWAAAVEAFFRASLGQNVSTGQVAEMYGAKKALVKERFEALSEALNHQVEA